MVRLVDFPQEMEHAVRFVEDTETDRIIEATLEKLRGGSISRLLRSRGRENLSLHHAASGT